VSTDPGFRGFARSFLVRANGKSQPVQGDDRIMPPPGSRLGFGGSVAQKKLRAASALAEAAGFA